MIESDRMKAELLKSSKETAGKKLIEQMQIDRQTERRQTQIFKWILTIQKKNVNIQIT